MALVNAASVAREYVALLTSGKFAQAAAMHDAAMAGALPEAALKSTLAQVPISDCRDESVTPAGAMQVVILNCAAGPQQRVLVKVTVDTSGNIAGLFFSPVPPPALPFTAAAYVDPSAFSEEKTTVKTGRFELPGTLSLPRGKGPFPAVVLLPGSGPQDEDETVGPNKPLKDLAQGLASRGVITLRYEKRTHKYGADITDTPGRYTVREEILDDAVSAVRLLLARKDVRGVVVLGHSLGGNVLPRLGKQLAELKGLVVMAGNVSPLEDLLVAQVTHILKYSAPSEAHQKMLADMGAVPAAVKAIKADSAPVFGAPASYWLDLRGYNPAAVAASLGQPMLLLQGGRDYQVPPTELALWKAALQGRSNVTTKTYAPLNHLFMAGTGVSVPAEYATAGHVDAAVIEDVAAFVKQACGG